MHKYLTVNKDKTATVSFYPSLEELNDLGYDSVYDMSDDLQMQVDDNYPGLLHFAEFDPESEGLMIYCDTEEIADTVVEELNEFIQYRSNMVSDAINFESGRQQADIKQAIDQLEKTLATLKNLLK